MAPSSADPGEACAPLLTELLRAVAEVARGHSAHGRLAKGSRATVGVHIYPTLEMNTGAYSHLLTRYTT